MWEEVKNMIWHDKSLLVVFTFSPSHLLDADSGLIDIVNQIDQSHLNVLVFYETNKYLFLIFQRMKPWAKVKHEHGFSVLNFYLVFGYILFTFCRLLWAQFHMDRDTWKSLAKLNILVTHFNQSNSLSHVGNVRMTITSLINIFSYILR